MARIKKPKPKFKVDDTCIVTRTNKDDKFTKGETVKITTYQGLNYGFYIDNPKPFYTAQNINGYWGYISEYQLKKIKLQK